MKKENVKGVVWSNKYKVREISKRHAKEIKDYFNNKCVVCGRTENLEIHHKNYDFDWKRDKKNLDEKISLLCKNCHKLTHKQNYLNIGSGFKILLVIHNTKKRLTITEISIKAKMSYLQTNQATHDLNNKGLIKLEKISSSKYVTLTETGKRIATNLSLINEDLKGLLIQRKKR